MFTYISIVSFQEILNTEDSQNMLMDEPNIECPNSKFNIFLEQQYSLIFPQAINQYNIHLLYHISKYKCHRIHSIKEF